MVGHGSMYSRRLTMHLKCARRSVKGMTAVCMHRRGVWRVKEPERVITDLSIISNKIINIYGHSHKDR